MTCGTCGATIADKAIVCYRCGAATAVPAAAGRQEPARRPWGLVLAVAIGVAVVLVVWYLVRR